MFRSVSAVNASPPTALIETSPLAAMTCAVRWSIDSALVMPRPVRVGPHQPALDHRREAAHRQVLGMLQQHVDSCAVEIPVRPRVAFDADQFVDLADDRSAPPSTPHRSGRSRDRSAPDESRPGRPVMAGCTSPADRPASTCARPAPGFREPRLQHGRPTAAHPTPVPRARDARSRRAALPVPTPRIPPTVRDETVRTTFESRRSPVGVLGRRHARRRLVSPRAADSYRSRLAELLGGSAGTTTASHPDEG